MPGQIFADLGERLTQALLGGDFVTYASVMALPLRIITRGGGSYVLHTEDELRADFKLYHDRLVGRDVTDIFRQVVDIRVIDTSHLKVRCRTHIMVRAQRIVDPFETQFLLVEQAEGWLISEIESARGHMRFALGLSEIKDGAFTSELDEEEDGDDQT